MILDSLRISFAKAELSFVTFVGDVEVENKKKKSKAVEKKLKAAEKNILDNFFLFLLLLLL